MRPWVGRRALMVHAHSTKLRKGSMNSATREEMRGPDDAGSRAFPSAGGKHSAAD